MDIKRLTEWLTSVDGLGAKLIAICGLPVSLSIALTRLLEGFVPVATAKAIAAVIVSICIMLLLIDFRRFSRASRLERPAKFTLRATGPNTLMGRESDVDDLLRTVRRYRVVLMDGESGCGKSALVSAGLVPRLMDSSSLLPCEIRDWGEDWVRGPLAAALDGLFNALSQTAREKLTWLSAPDLAGSEAALIEELNQRLEAIVTTLDQRTLLIADQFDDYQASYRSSFLDSDSNWIVPEALANANPFWKAIRDGVHRKTLHLLVIARSDTAAGMSCVRFSGQVCPQRTLTRVDNKLLRPVLWNVAPDDAAPPVVSNPECGWKDLRDRVEFDLARRGPLLMQQVRTVLLGLRHLPMLTPRHYRRAGGLEGLEALAVAAAVHAAGESAGGGDAGRTLVRKILNALVVPGKRDQPPKARRELLSKLDRLVGDHRKTRLVLECLRQDEIVRPARAIAGGEAWQLDHDYLATAVLEDAKGADRWRGALRDGAMRHADAKHGFAGWWTTLLPLGVLVRIIWERLLGRLRFGSESGYAMASSVKLAMLALVASAIAFGGYQIAALAAANNIVSQFGGGEANRVTLIDWRSSETVRSRVYDVIRFQEGALERALQSGWAGAHAGIEPDRLDEVLDLLHTRLSADATNTDRLASYRTTYSFLARRLDGARAKAVVVMLRAGLETAKPGPEAAFYATAYTVAAQQLRNTDVRDEANKLQALVAKEIHGPKFLDYATAYEVVAGRGVGDVKSTAAQLLDLIKKAPMKNRYALEKSYLAVIKQFTPADAATEISAIRADMESNYSSGSDVYVALAARLSESDAKSEVVALRKWIDYADSGRLFDLPILYAAVAPRLTDADAREQAEELWPQLSSAWKDASDRAPVIAKLFAAVGDRMDEVRARAAAIELHSQLAEGGPNSVRPELSFALGALARNLSDSDVDKAAAIIHSQIPSTGRLGEGVLIKAYSRVSARLSPAGAKVEARRWLNDTLGEEDALARLPYPPSPVPDATVTAYRAAASQLDDGEARHQAHALRLRVFKPTKRSSGAAVKFYSAVVGRLSEPELRRETDALFDELGAADDTRSATGLSIAYGKAATALIAHSSEEQRRELVRKLLVMCGHPFLEDASALVEALEAVAGKELDSISAAREWARKKYDFDLKDFRPSALDDTKDRKVSAIDVMP